MGGGEAIRSLGRIGWPGEPGLNNAKPRFEGRQPGSYHPSEAKTPGEALSYIELLYKSGRMEDLAQLLRRSQVFRAAWLILQSSPAIFETPEGVKGSSCRGENHGPAYLPVPVSGPASLPLNPEPKSPGPEAGRAELSPQTPAAGMYSDGGNDAFAARASKAVHPLTSLLQVYQYQDRYGVREKQRGQLISLRA
jgi:hypothetical protein